MPNTPNKAKQVVLTWLAAATAGWFTCSALAALRGLSADRLEQAWRCALAVAAWLALAIAWRAVKSLPPTGATPAAAEVRRETGAAKGDRVVLALLVLLTLSLLLLPVVLALSLFIG